jgi:hypothetical protein
LSTINGKLDTNIGQEEKVVDEITRALRYLGAGNYSCMYGDDPAGDLALKFENSRDTQTIVLESGSWPDAIFERVIGELRRL